MPLMTYVEANQECRDLLDDARILQLAPINRVNPWNLHRQFHRNLSRFRIVATDDYVAINVIVSIEYVGRAIVERCRNRDSFGHKFGRLLRG